MRIPRFSTLQLLLAAAFCGLVCGLFTTAWRSAVHRQIDAIAFSPNGATLAARYSGGTFQAWRVETGAARLPMRTSMGRTWTDEWRPVRFADDDTLIDIQPNFRSGSPTVEVRAIDLRGAVLKGLLSLPHLARSPPFAASGNRLAVGNWATGTIECYDLSSRKLVHQVPGAVSSPYGLDLSPDGKQVLFFDQDSELHVADVASEQSVPLGASPGTVFAELTRDGRYVVTMGSRSSAVEVHDLKTGTPPERIHHEVGSSQWLALTADGRRLAVAGNDSVELYDLDTSQRIGRIAFGDLRRSSIASPMRNYSLGWQQLALAPDGQLLAAIDGDQIMLWDMKTGKARQTLGGSQRWAQVVVFTLGFVLWSAAWGYVARKSRDRGRLAAEPPLELKLCWGIFANGGLVAIFIPIAMFILSGNLFWPTMYYSLLMGILAVARAAGRDTKGPRQVAYLQMLNLIALDPVNFLLGLLALALLRRPAVRQYLAEVNARPGDAASAPHVRASELSASHA